MAVQYDTPGWQLNDRGWWYAADAATCYVNGWLELEGNQYHFDSNGYMDTGWTAIGGKGCYFDQNGVYDPNADSSMMIALTYDDGPSQYTSQLLDILQSNGVKATFMMLGSKVEQYGAETIPRMVQLGCTLGNHSYDHSNLREAGPEAAQQQFSQTDGLIAQYNNGVSGLPVIDTSLLPLEWMKGTIFTRSLFGCLSGGHYFFFPGAGSADRRRRIFYAGLQTSG